MKWRTVRDDSHPIDLDGEAQPLFTSWDWEEKEEQTNSRIDLHFVAGNEGVQFAHGLRPSAERNRRTMIGRPHWRGLLRKPSPEKVLHALT